MSCRLDNLTAQRVAAGHTVTRLAQLANVSDALILRLEAATLASGPRIGGTCSPGEADRICAALGVTRATAGFTEQTG